eukprot:CAMPEP_0116113604 /NCGR_PEP_ID=MMETSP0327-20121206/19592_1 /TAXON_ID=44447 /ORGANISM="Pseudo-nitzschia delicatissima, Strain B596" /LENGTH=581 /DNA_ID=CAMNT_0003606963 /DNA_START=137 /DNA_END=1882 /DNA_ORIENTATION=+
MAPAKEETTEEPEAGDDPMSYESSFDSNEFKRSFALNYKMKKKPKVLFAMALGFPEFDGILDRPPISTIKRKELNDQYVPKAEDYKNEIKRRAHYFMNDSAESSYYTDQLKRAHPLKTKRSSIVLPQPNQWLNTQLKKWLTERPLNPSDNDVRFLRYQIKRALDFLTSDVTNTVNGQDVLQEFPVLPTPADAPLDGPAISGASNGEGEAKPSVPITETIMASTAHSSSNVTQNLGTIETEPYVYTTPHDSDVYKLSAAGTYLLKGKQPRTLFAMAHGTPELQSMIESATSNLVKRKEVTEEFMPRAEDYRYEIKRRANYFMNMEEQKNYYLQDLETKNPLENMRGIVTLPQPAQWKVHALKQWLAERPLKPDERDSKFLKASIKKCTNALNEAVMKDPSLTQHGVKRTASMMLASSDLHDLTGDAPLLQVLAKQDAILGAVKKQNQQQSILNKITILTQSIMGYNQEISILRSTHNDIENRILTVEMKIAENSDAEEGLKKLIAKHEERKAEVDTKIQELETKIAGVRVEIDEHNEALEAIDVEEPEEEPKEEDEDDVEPPKKKAKIEEDVEEEAVEKAEV